MSNLTSTSYAPQPVLNSSSSSTSSHTSKTSSQISTREKTAKKTANVLVACINCKKARAKCSHERPCDRCIRIKKTETCKDVVHKRKSSEDRHENKPEQLLKINVVLNHTIGILNQDMLRSEGIIDGLKQETDQLNQKTAQQAYDILKLKQANNELKQQMAQQSKAAQQAILEKNTRILILQQIFRHRSAAHTELIRTLQKLHEENVALRRLTMQQSQAIMQARFPQDQSALLGTDGLNQINLPRFQI